MPLENYPLHSELKYMQFLRTILNNFHMSLADKVYLMIHDLMVNGVIYLNFVSCLRQVEQF